jgi:hypothetical protein
MTMRPGEHLDELISASLTGDLSEPEQAALTSHLATCARCRDTLAAFGEERRLISGLRHVTPPRDLGARVRTGIDSGIALPWWRRTSSLLAGTAVLGAVAAGLLAVVVLNNLRPANVAQQPSASPSAQPTVEISLSPQPTASIVPSIEPEPTATAPAPPIDPEPIAALVYTVDAADSQIEVVTETGRQTLPLEMLGTPTDATLSPDGDWVAFTIFGEGQGLVDAYAYRLSDASLVPLATGGQVSPFSRFSWSADGRVLAYTSVADDGSADAWVFYPDERTTRQLTSTGTSFAASFVGGDDRSAQLWVSVASEGQPNSYRLSVPLSSADLVATDDPAASAEESAAGSFLPMLNDASAASWAAVWRGAMASGDGGWHFDQGGMLYMVPAADGVADLDAEGTQVFTTLSLQQNGAGFTSARFEWSPDGDGFAVWDADWAGTEQGPGFPDQLRVYFGHASTGNGDLITPAQALDAADTEGAREVIDVALAGGQYLALTLRMDEFQGNEFAPVSSLVLVTRHTGTTPDEVRVYGTEGVWNGPALYPASLDETP